jgi:hypothetical protein
MVVRFAGQPVTALRPAILKNATTFRGLHTSSKTMHTCAAAFFGLVCSLWHSASLPILTMIWALIARTNS